MTSAVLTLTDVTAGYDGVPAIRGVSLSVRPGEVVALLGPNGAGKTTTLRAISGLVRRTSGHIEVLGGDIPSLRRAHRLARRGLVHVPESRNVFGQLSVRENLSLSTRRRASWDVVLEVFPALVPLLDRRSALLSGGERQMLALAGALLAEPRLLMVDELSMGLAPQIYAQLVPILRRVADDSGVGVLMVEQHADLALKHSDHAFILVSGELVEEGASAELLRDPSLLAESYLGGAL